MRGLRPRTPAEHTAAREDMLTEPTGHARLAFAACLGKCPAGFLWDMTSVLNARVLRELGAGNHKTVEQLLRRTESVNRELENRMRLLAGGMCDAH
jgi:hypothetical protein